MIIANKETTVKKQPFALLKKNVCDDSRDLEEMINRVKDFEEGMDYEMHMNKRNVVNKKNENNNRTLFTQETIRAAKAVSTIHYNDDNQYENVR